MNKEFPPDRWLRKHTVPLHMVGAMIGLLLLIIFASKIAIPFLMTAILCVIGMTVWQIFWHFKYPYQVEFCKECNQALPEKYED